jgi:uncharacterized lipoprotein NlpE involved in copper resistance
MKKLVLMFVAIAAVSFASCGNKAADQAAKQADSIRVADSIAAAEAEAAAAAAADTTATADSAATTAAPAQK